MTPSPPAPPRAIGTTDRAALRAWIPEGYRPFRHIAVLYGGGAAAVVALLAMHASLIGPADLLAVPVTFLVGTFLEYVSHRWLIHRRRAILPLAYDAHTGRHHHYFRHDAPTWEQPRDIWLILFSLSDVAILCLVLALPALGLRSALPPGAWALAVSSAIVYFLAYEALHLVWHLPAEHALFRQAWLDRRRRRHLRHHELGEMAYNFGVTVSWWDHLFVTARPPR